MFDIGKHLILQLIFIIISAVFTSAYTATESVNTAKLRTRADDGDKKAQRLLKITDEPEKYLPAIRNLSVLSGFLGAAFASYAFASPLAEAIGGLINVQLSGNAVGVAVTAVVLVFFNLLLGEYVPKRVSLRHDEKLADFYCGLVRFFAWLFTPATWLLNALSDLLVRLFGIDPKENEEAVSEEDIVMMLDAGAEDGTLNKENIEYIKNVFELDHLTAADVMTPRNSIELISCDASDADIVKLIEESGYSRIPVYTETVDNITGILHARDYLLKHGEDGFKLADAMYQPTFVPETVHLDALFKDMQTDHSHMVIVVDEYGGTAGLVTMEDILEEIVGEIWDEQDEEIENFVQTDENTYRILSTTPIDEFFDFFSLGESSEIESATVNGWVTEHSGNIPKQGFLFTYKNLTVTVTKADELHTEEICVRVEPKPADDDTEQTE